MKKCKTLWLALLLVCGSVSAQKKLITGRVIDNANNQPLLGVSVLAVGQKGGVATNTEGKYSIQVDSKTTTLIFSFVGYKSQSVHVNKSTNIDISLVSSAVSNDEVVVIGYGTQKRSSVTGAVSKYQNDRLDETSSSRIDQALQGKIAGVTIQNVASEAGADPKVQVRGISSINANASPLVVVDGQPVPDGLGFINMADVASVEVLKDAASAAIYGSRGANGVILITTKSGKSGKPKFNLKYSVGNKQAYELYPMMTTSEYTNMLFYEASLKLKDTSITPPTTTQIASTAERGAYIIENTLRGGAQTDWQHQAIRNAGIKNLQMNVSGGNSGLKYYFGAGYQNDQGMMYHSEFERFNAKSKIDAELSKRIKLTINVNPSYIKRERPSVNYIDFVRFQSYLPVYVDSSNINFIRQNPAYTSTQIGDFVQANMYNGRVYSGLMPDGSFYNTVTPVNPFSTSNNTPKTVLETRSITSNEYRLLSSAELNINIIPGLNFKSLLSNYISYSRGLDFAKRNSNRAGDVNTGIYSNNLYIDLLNENTFNYTKKIKGHTFNILAWFTAEKTKSNLDHSVGQDYPSDNITTLNQAKIIVAPSLDANGNLQGTYNYKSSIGLLSYLGRITYDYQNKYLFAASFRTDGSSKFGPGQKWGSFPSVSLGWVASKEKFLQNVNWLDNLKLRLSYGTTGNNNIQDYGFVDVLYPVNYSFGTASSPVSSGQVPSPNIQSNPNITWERTFQYNAGIDVSLLKNAISFSLDIYQSKTDRLLLQQANMAFTGVDLFFNNIGSLKNNGIELAVNTNNINTKNFKWTTSGNISHTRNVISELGAESKLLNQGERTELYLNMVGGPLVQFYGYKTDGVWLSQAEINDAQAKGLKSSLSNVFVPGGLKLVDVDGNNIIDANDRVVTGNPYPKFTWGLVNNFTLHNFDLSFSFQGVQGGSLINGDPNYNETKRYNKNYNQNRWISPMFPGDGKPPSSTLGFNSMLTDYVVEDASYYALREVLLGYTLPGKWIERAKLSSLRFYFSAQNLFFHAASGYRGINPEGRFNSGPYATPLIDGYQRGSFPFQKTFLLGVDLNF